MAAGRSLPRGGPAQGLELHFPALFLPPKQIEALVRLPSSLSMTASASDLLASAESVSGVRRPALSTLPESGPVDGSAATGTVAPGATASVALNRRSLKKMPSRKNLNAELSEGLPSPTRSISSDRVALADVGGVPRLLRRQLSTKNVVASVGGAIQAARQLRMIAASTKMASKMSNMQGGALKGNSTPRAANPRLPYTVNRRGRLLCCDPNVGTSAAISDDPRAGWDLAIAHLLREPCDPASVKVSEGRLDWFVTDYFLKNLGLQALAIRTINTLLKCVRGFRHDPRVGTFASLLIGALPSQVRFMLPTYSCAFFGSDPRWMTLYLNLCFAQMISAGCALCRLHSCSLSLRCSP